MVNFAPVNTQQNTGRDEFVRAAAEMRALEAALSEQLEALRRLDDARLGACASVLQRSARIAAACGSAAAAVKWNLAGAMAAKTVVAAGRAVSARNHNRRLESLLADKRRIASDRLAMLRALRPRIDRAADSFGRLMQACAGRSLAPGWAAAAGESLWQALECRRSALHFQALAAFLEDEYTAWLAGRQRGDTPFPTPADANRHVAAELFREASLRSAFEEAAADGIADGRSLMLLSDPALVMMALHDGGEPMELDLSQCAPEAAEVLRANPALGAYGELTGAYTAAARRNPLVAWDITAFILAADTLAVFWACGEFTLAARIAGTAVYAVLGARIWLTTRRRIITAHVAAVRALGGRVADYVRGVCGDYTVAEADLSPRDPAAEALNAFFND